MASQDSSPARRIVRLAEILLGEALPEGAMPAEKPRRRGIAGLLGR